VKHAGEGEVIQHTAAIAAENQERPDRREILGIIPMLIGNTGGGVTGG